MTTFYFCNKESDGLLCGKERGHDDPCGVWTRPDGRPPSSELDLVREVAGLVREIADADCLRGSREFRGGCGSDGSMFETWCFVCRAKVVVNLRPARPTWDEYFLAIAEVVAARATCDRKHVGAVIVDPKNDIVATGYNGAPRGMPHCSGPDGVGHELKTIEGRQSCVRTLHAESNALDSAGRNARDGVLYVTVTPCYPCAQRIVNAGIRRVVYGEWYQSQNTDLVVAFFDRAGIEMTCPRRSE